MKSHAISLLVLSVLASSGCLDDPTPNESDTRDVADTSSETSDASDADDTQDIDTTDDTNVDADTAAPDSRDTDGDDSDLSAPDADVPDGDALVDATDAVDLDSADAGDSADADDSADAGDSADAADGDVTPSSPLGLVLTEEASGWTIANSEILVAFGADTGWLPRDLRGPVSSGGDRSDNLVYGRATGPTHTNEEWVGLSLFDLAHLWSELTEPSLRATGPAVMQTYKSWSYAGFMSGSTLMTIHADGRIVLSYDIAVSNPRTATLVAYAALDISRFTHVRSGSALLFDLPSGTTPADDFRFLGGSEMTDSGYLCASNPLSGDVVGFVGHPIAELNPLMPRITENAHGAQDPHSVRLQYDLARESVPAGTYAARLLLTVDKSGVCARVAEQAAAFRTPPTFEVSAGVAITDEQGDVDHDGFLETTGTYVFAAPNGALELSPQSSLPGFTLRVIAANWSTPVVALASTPLVAGIDFLAQPADSGSGGWITILVPLVAHSTLTIDW